MEAQSKYDVTEIWECLGPLLDEPLLFGSRKEQEWSRLSDGKVVVTANAFMIIP